MRGVDGPRGARPSQSLMLRVSARSRKWLHPHGIGLAACLLRAETRAAQREVAHGMCSSGGVETMRRAIALLTLLLVTVSTSYAEHRGRGVPGPPHPPGPGVPHFPGRPFHGEHDQFHGHGPFVAGPSFWWDPWWWDYPVPYYYPAPPPVVVQPAPVIVEEQSPQSYWYYCSSAGAYYPTAPTCPEPWVKVPPQAE